MDENAINSLKEALKYSPENIPLKQHLAEMLVKANRLDEAETEYSELLSLTADFRIKTGLAKVFFLIMADFIPNGYRISEIHRKRMVLFQM